MTASRDVKTGAPIIVAQAPCRADLAGGTIDLWPLYVFHPGALTLNFAVNIQTSCRITPLRGKRGARKNSRIWTNYAAAAAFAIRWPHGWYSSSRHGKVFSWKQIRNHQPAPAFPALPLS